MEKVKGLYYEGYEHDACGVGMVVNINGNKSHALVDNALRVLENMQHRGAETRDKTGDGAGILLQIPHEFILLQGIPVPEKGKYGTGIVFLPKDATRQSECCSSGLHLTIFHFFARKFYIFELIFLLLQKFVRKKTEITNKNSAKQWKR